MTKGKLTIVSGVSGLGKTRWCLSLWHTAQSQKISCDGILSPAVFSGQNKMAIDLLDVQTGQRRQLAHARTTNQTAEGVVQTAGWQFVNETFVWGNALLVRSGRAEITFIDEIGPVEFTKHSGLDQALQLLNEGRYLHLYLTLRPALIDAAQSRWPVTEIIDLSSTTVDPVSVIQRL